MIDLRSDTVTRPTEQMRKAIMNAEVGDDVYREDPTVNKLEQLAAEMLGKEAALLVTSGTQGNQLAVLAHTQPSDEIILDADAHIFYYEGGAVSALAGIQTRTIESDNGQMPLEKIKNAIREKDIHFPKTALICLENTHNRGGGVVLPVSYMEDVHKLAQARHIPVHLDGARLFNAAVAANVRVTQFTKSVDTVQICLSKGLSAPMGSIIAGPKAFIEEARVWRKRLGGGMRQAGIMAAPGIIALTEMVDRLAEDHERAKKLAHSLSSLKGVTIDANAVETNIVLMQLDHEGYTANEFISELKKEGVLAIAYGPYTVRLMTHREVTDSHIEQAICAVNRTHKQLTTTV